MIPRNETPQRANATTQVSAHELHTDSFEGGPRNSVGPGLLKGGQANLRGGLKLLAEKLHRWAAG